MSIRMVDPRTDKLSPIPLWWVSHPTILFKVTLVLRELFSESPSRAVAFPEAARTEMFRTNVLSSLKQITTTFKRHEFFFWSSLVGKSWSTTSFYIFLKCLRVFTKWTFLSLLTMFVTEISTGPCKKADTMKLLHILPFCYHHYHGNRCVVAAAGQLNAKSYRGNVTLCQTVC